MNKTGPVIIDNDNARSECNKRVCKGRPHSTRNKINLSITNTQ